MSGSPSSRGSIERKAAEWLALSDARGLTPAETTAFDAWLAADSRHRAAVAQLREAWTVFGRLRQYPRPAGAPADPDVLAPPRRQRWTVPLAAAAAIAFGLFIWRGAPVHPLPVSAPALPAPPAGWHFASGNATRQVRLRDHSIVELNTDSEIVEEFTPAERRLLLLHGEATFRVAKNPNRPFIVSSEGIAVRAVGTIFNVRLDGKAMDVLVTEGKVRVAHEASPESAAHAQALPSRVEVPLLVAGQHTVIRIDRGKASPPPVIETLTPEAIDRALAWQTSRLVFDSTPLADVAARFNRKNQRQIVVPDPDLAGLRISGRFRSDDVDGFVQLLEASFGVKADRRPDGTILLRRVR